MTEGEADAAESNFSSRKVQPNERLLTGGVKKILFINKINELINSFRTFDVSIFFWFWLICN